MIKPWLLLLLHATLLATQQAFALDVDLRASPSVVGASSAVISISLIPEQTIPKLGGFRIIVPTLINSTGFACKIVDPLSIVVASCSIEKGTHAVLMISN